MREKGAVPIAKASFILLATQEKVVLCSRLNFLKIGTFSLASAVLRKVAEGALGRCRFAMRAGARIAGQPFCFFGYSGRVALKKARMLCANYWEFRHALLDVGSNSGNWCLRAQPGGVKSPPVLDCPEKLWSTFTNASLNAIHLKNRMNSCFKKAHLFGLKSE